MFVSGKHLRIFQKILPLRKFIFYKHWLILILHQLLPFYSLFFATQISSLAFSIGTNEYFSNLQILLGTCEIQLVLVNTLLFSDARTLHAPVHDYANYTNLCECNNSLNMYKGYKESVWNTRKLAQILFLWKCSLLSPYNIFSNNVRWHALQMFGVCDKSEK